MRRRSSLACPPIVVERESRHARNFLGRLQFHSDGAEEASRTQGHSRRGRHPRNCSRKDVHYMDGVFHVDEFELTMDLDQGRCGAPDFSLDEPVIGPRMESPPWSLNYMKHQPRRCVSGARRCGRSKRWKWRPF